MQQEELLTLELPAQVVDVPIALRGDLAFLGSLQHF
jgi:hypothetical protein